MKIKIFTLCVVISLLLLVTWSNVFAADASNPQDPATPKGNNMSFCEQITDANVLFFVLSCGVISILVKIVDYAIETNKVENTQTIENFWQKVLRWEWFLWFLSAAIVGLLTHLVGLSQPTAITAVAVGLGWPVLFAQLKARYASETQKTEAVNQRANGIYEDLDFGEEQITSNECYDIDEKEGT